MFKVYRVPLLMHAVTGTLKPPVELTDEEFMDVLEATKGSMVSADWNEAEKKLDRLAKQELKEMKANAW